MIELALWGVVALVVVVFVAIPILDYLLWRLASEDGKRVGAQMGKRGYGSGFSAYIADQLLAEVPTGDDDA